MTIVVKACSCIIRRSAANSPSDSCGRVRRSSGSKYLARLMAATEKGVASPRRCEDRVRNLREEAAHRTTTEATR